jgi:hypothetical protein
VLTGYVEVNVRKAELVVTVLVIVTEYVEV